MREELFRDPPMDCRAAPFWSWNGELEPSETRWQVREMATHGMGGAFLHARSGLRTEYLGEDWFANVTASVEEGKRLGFSSWLYDEDCWPSGSCSGRTAAADPDFCGRALVYQRGEGPLLPHDQGVPPEGMELLACFTVAQEVDAEPRFTRAARSRAGAPEVVSFYASTFGPLDPGRSHYPDLMHDGAIREFIRNTYEQYAERFEPDFGSAIPGVFTDEPLLQGELPWSVRFATEFRQRRGYDLVRKLPHLAFLTAESPKVRHDYWQTIAELFRESYMAQLGHWCGEHRLAFTGHLMAEGGLAAQIRRGGGCMGSVDLFSSDMAFTTVREVARGHHFHLPFAPPANSLSLLLVEPKLAEQLAAPRGR